MRLVDSCEVEPALEKGALEDSEKKVESDVAIAVEDIESASRKLADADKEVLVQEPGITQDQFSHQRDGKKMSRAFHQELDLKDATSSNAEELSALRGTPQAKKTRWYRPNDGSQQRWNKQKFRHFFNDVLLLEKFHCWMRRAVLDEVWSSPWMLWPKSHRHASTFFGVCFECLLS